MSSLIAHPSVYRKITDQAEARELLIECGLLEQMEKLSRPPGHQSEWMTSIPWLKHRTHWLVAVVYSGFAKAEDNGYVIYCVPKSRCSVYEFKRASAVGVDSLFSGAENQPAPPAAKPPTPESPAARRPPET